MVTIDCSQITYFDGEERDPRLKVECLELPEHLPHGGHYFDGLHFDERGLVLKFQDGDCLHPRTYEMQVVFSGAFENLRVSRLDTFQDAKLMLYREKTGASALRFWAFSCKYTNYFNWYLEQTLDREYIEKNARHYVMGVTDSLVEIISVEPPKIFFRGFGMDIPEGTYREYPCCDLLYNLP